MISYIIKGFFRSLLRRKLFSFINITGLAFGIGFVILIGQYLYHEYSYNSSLENVDNIYRIVNANTKEFWVDLEAKEKLKETIPGIKNITVFNHYGIEANKANDVFKLDNLIVTDKDFIKINKLSFISGNKRTALDNPDGIVISESAARRIFGKADVVGRHLTLNHSYEFFIYGVIKDFPSNSSFQADVIVSYENSLKQRIYYNGMDTPSGTKYFFNYLIELYDNADIKQTEKLISGILEEQPMFHKQFRAVLEPLKTNYFNTEYNDNSLPHVNNNLVGILTWIGAAILLLAVFNFVNLTTAAYKYRMTEIGIKKCLGINRIELIKQLLLETFFICIISSGIGIILAEVCLPYFNNYTEKVIFLQIFSSLKFQIIFFLFIVLLSLLTGFLPALILSKISPLQLFRTKSFIKKTGNSYRSILTTFQFVVTIVLICSLIIMLEQISFVKHKNPGFNTAHLLYLPIHYKSADKIPALYNKLSGFHTIESISKTFGIPGSINLTSGNNWNYIHVDSIALTTFGFKIIKGRNFLPGDVNRACLVNETAWKDLELNGFRDTTGWQFKIVGVVSDFQVAPLYNKNQPLRLDYTEMFGTSHLTLKIKGSVQETIAYLEKTWKELCSDYPLEYGFYDEYFAAQYKKEENLATIISMFSVLAIVISCMGIFGLAFYQSEQRVKEIGIRKVLGASSAEIVSLLTGNFSKWVLLANIFAWPAAYYFMTKWLETFAYRIELSWWMFVLSGFIALVIALVTISTQTIKAAIANHVKSLKYE